jgi:hypothetical protein
MEARRVRTVTSRRAVVVLVSLLLAVAAACAVRPSSKPRAPAKPTPTAASFPQTTIPTSTRPPGPSTPTTVVTSQCGQHPSGTWTQVGTIHTVVPGDAPLDITVNADPHDVCPGGTVQLTIDVTNRDDAPVDVAAPQIILGRSVDKWSIGSVPERIVLDAHGSTSFVVTVTLPPVQPGTYGVSVYGYEPGGTLTVI